MPGWIGRNLGKVNVELLLARGGMAEVYLGRHTTLQRAVVVKVLKNQFEDDPELLDRFEREARAVAMLRHPNIVQVFDFDTVEGHPYIVMEYIPGLSLATYMRALHSKKQRLDLRFVSEFISAIAGALDYAHERGIVHRDVKPGNILLTSPSSPLDPEKPLPADTLPVLTDFGLVRFMHSTHQTTAGQISGTPAYMSPEQALGETVDSRTDIYSLGIVLYEILAGHVPFEADSTLGVLNKHVHEPPAAIPGLPSELQRVIDRALAKNPAARYQTPGEFAAALQAAAQQRSEAPTVTETDPNRMAAGTPAVWRRLRRSRWLPVGLGGVAVLALAYFALNYFHVLPSAAAPYASYDASNVVGVLSFQDGSAMVDEVTMTATGMAPPPQGSQYEVWLIEESGEQMRSIGVLPLDGKGDGTVSFVDPQGRNLLGVYNKMEITIEPKPDPSPNPSNTVAFSAVLPSGGLTHVRHLIVAFDSAPNKIGLADGLLKDATLVDSGAKQMLTAYQNNQDAAARLQAEAMLNVIVGDQSPDHRDWNGDGQISDPSDGWGLLLNGDNEGYIQGTYSHADYAATSPDATAEMKLHGGHVKICAQNLEQWTPKLRDLLKQILTSPAGTDLGPMVRQAVAYADDMLKGTDINGNEQVEPIPGEGGAETAYDHAYYMADMDLLKK